MSEDARAAALQVIDNTVFSLMPLQDGVTDLLANDEYYVTLRTVVQLRRSRDDAVLHVDGMCMAGQKAILAMRR